METKALYLLQLWSDTFMMEQDRYPDFHQNYRTLRAEGVKFPERDPNERLLMEGISAVESPMFDFVEQKNGVVKPAPLVKEKPEVEMKKEFVDDDPQFEEKEDFKKYARGPLD